MGVAGGRGLCRPCWASAKRLVGSGVTTWGDLEARGKVLPDLRHQRLNWLMDDQNFLDSPDRVEPLVSLITGLNAALDRGVLMRNLSSSAVLAHLKKVGVRGYNPVWLGRRLSQLHDLFPERVYRHRHHYGTVWNIVGPINHKAPMGMERELV